MNGGIREPGPDERRRDRGRYDRADRRRSPDDQRLLGAIRRGHHRSVSGSRSQGLAHPRPLCPAPAQAFRRVRPRRRRSRRGARSAGEAPRKVAEPARSLAACSLEIGNVDDYAATLKRVLQSQPIDVVFLPMAVADFEPEPQPGKISSDAESLVLHCRRTPKVIRLVRDWSPSVYLVGFKLFSRASREELIRARRDRLPRQSGGPHRRQRPPDLAPGTAHDPPGPPGP